MSFKQDLRNNIFYSQSSLETTAAFIVNELFFSYNKIFIYTKHIWTFLGNIYKHFVLYFGVRPISVNSQEIRYARTYFLLKLHEK